MNIVSPARIPLPNRCVICLHFRIESSRRRRHINRCKRVHTEVSALLPSLHISSLLSLPFSRTCAWGDDDAPAALTRHVHDDDDDYDGRGGYILQRWLWTPRNHWKILFPGVQDSQPLPPPGAPSQESLILKSETLYPSTFVLTS